jgi:uroporphyrinogen-III synthase
VFFSSSACAKHFLEIVDLSWLATKQIACIGKGTGRFLKDKGIIPQFEGVGDVSEVGEHFRNVLKNNSVLFPHGNLSLRTVQKSLPIKQVLELMVYETKDVRHSQPKDVDVVAFTSPSNVNSYFNQFKENPSTSYIAIGQTTSKQLTDKGINHSVAWEPSLLALADLANL